eukprot:335102-Chlamydomonas_euryale.AAC.3
MVLVAVEAGNLPEALVPSAVALDRPCQRQHQYSACAPSRTRVTVPTVPGLFTLCRADPGIQECCCCKWGVLPTRHVEARGSEGRASQNGGGSRAPHWSAAMTHARGGVADVAQLRHTPHFWCAATQTHAAPVSRGGPKQSKGGVTTEGGGRPKPSKGGVTTEGGGGTLKYIDQGMGHAPAQKDVPGRCAHKERGQAKYAARRHALAQEDKNQGGEGRTCFSNMRIDR